MKFNRYKKEVLLSSSESRLQTLRWLIRIRWIAIVLLLLLVLFVEPKTPFPLLIGSIWAVLLAAAFFNLIFQVLSYFPRLVGSAILMVFLIDGVLVSAGVALTGGPVSPFIPLYLLIITSACLTASPWQALWVSGFQIVLFAVTVVYSYQKKLMTVLGSGESDSFSYLLEHFSA